MPRFISIASALGEAAVSCNRQPSADDFARIEVALRQRIVIDFDTGRVAVRYDDGFVGDLATFVESELTRPWIETRSAPRAEWADSDFAADF